MLKMGENYETKAKVNIEIRNIFIEYGRWLEKNNIEDSICSYETFLEKYQN